MVYHVLADGTLTKDITGHVVRYKDAEAVYDLMGKIKVKRPNGRDKEAVCQK